MTPDVAGRVDSTLLKTWTQVSPWRNLLSLLLDYFTAASLIAAAVFFVTHRETWGLSPLWNLPVCAAAIILVGCVQHRFGLAGHEGSHYLLHPNRKVNDILSELFCFFPVFATLTNYRAKHLSHHLYPNDPARDGNLASPRARALYERFPMPRNSFIYHYYLKFFWPPFVIRNLRDLFRVVTIGSGYSPVSKHKSSERKRFYQNSTYWGIAYVLLLVAINNLARPLGLSGMALLHAASLALALFIWRLLPDSWFNKPGGAKLAYSPRLSALLRLGFMAVLLATLGLSSQLTGTWNGGYFLLFWVLPLAYVAPYLMLLRETMQHANADAGKYTNTRVMHTDPFTRWAVLGYGNDIHLVHHLYPNIPHYRLTQAHLALKEQLPAYRNEAQETYGTFNASSAGAPSLLGALSGKTEVVSKTGARGAGGDFPGI